MAIKTDVQERKRSSVKGLEERSLILFNDDYNTFEHVIECLMDVCGHNPFQAEQCAMITHYKGKCSVKSGAYESLYPFKSALNERGLEAIIK
jgi:ATP-dependent Clp protease adaptor protein ClpS